MMEQYFPRIERREAAGEMNFVIVCEHASNLIPSVFANLGLDAAALQSHIAWDPGALGVAQALRRIFSGDLVAGAVSRLLYDCNRPPDAPSAMPDRSEIFDIPGNQSLSAVARAARTGAIYEPFRAALTAILDERQNGIMVTVHSFTPVYFGMKRTSEIGLLHDDDTRLADAMLMSKPQSFPYKLERNVPYSARDGVTHTLRAHAIERGWPNVMLEIRNDLIETSDQQAVMARHLAGLLSSALPHLKEPGHV